MSEPGRDLTIRVTYRVNDRGAVDTTFRPELEIAGPDSESFRGRYGSNQMGLLAGAMVQGLDEIRFGELTFTPFMPSIASITTDAKVTRTYKLDQPLPW